MLCCGLCLFFFACCFIDHVIHLRHLDVADLGSQFARVGFQSPGSQPTPSRQALGTLSEQIAQAVKSGFEVTYNGGAASDLIHCGNFCDVEDVLRCMGVEKSASTAITLDLGLLGMNAEPWVQNHLQEHFFQVTSAKALDLSANCQGPFFKAPQKIEGQGEAVYLRTAKPDGVSLVSPMCLEIKSDKKIGLLATIDWEVLAQALDRVLVQMRLFGFLSIAIALAATGRSAWCVFALRKFPSDNHGEELTLHFFRIVHRDVNVVWASVTDAARFPSFFLTEDGPQLIHVLKQAKIDPWYSRVKWLASSMSRVYLVTLPKQFSWGNTTVLGVDGDVANVTYAIKIVRDCPSFEMERQVVQNLAASAPGITCALGSCAFNGDTTCTCRADVTSSSYSCFVLCLYVLC